MPISIVIPQDLLCPPFLQLIELQVQRQDQANRRLFLRLEELLRRELQPQRPHSILPHFVNSYLKHRQIHNLTVQDVTRIGASPT